MCSLQRVCMLLLGLLVLTARPVDSPGRDLARQGKSGSYPPTSEYETQHIHGWDVLVNKSLLMDKPELANKTLELLRFQLFQIVRVVPKTALSKLQGYKIWVEDASPPTPCMAYHPDPRWLVDHGLNPDKAKCVELANAEAFLDWTKAQPWMVLHELAHAYHHQALEDGFENKALKEAYESAMKEKRYDSVLRIQGRREKAYACNNPMEYFAEATEAYFGTNDFYPFVKIELAEHDKACLKLLDELWGQKSGTK